MGYFFNIPLVLNFWSGVYIYICMYRVAGPTLTSRPMAGSGLYMQPSVQSVGGAGGSGGGVKMSSNTWQTGKKSTPLGGGGSGGGGSGGPNRSHHKSKMAPRPQQLHYCDVCKISCAGPLTYRYEGYLAPLQVRCRGATSPAGKLLVKLGLLSSMIRPFITLVLGLSSSMMYEHLSLWSLVFHLWYEHLSRWSIAFSLVKPKLKWCYALHHYRVTLNTSSREL